MNKNTKRKWDQTKREFKPRKSAHPKVARSGPQISKKLHPPFGIRPEYEAYLANCAARGLRP